MSNNINIEISVNNVPVPIVSDLSLLSAAAVQLMVINSSQPEVKEVDLSLLSPVPVQLTVQNNNAQIILTEIALGPKGDSGAALQFFTGIAGENISGGKIVYSLGSKLYNFDPFDISLYGRTFGISITAALLNQSLTVQWGGIFTQTGLGLTADGYNFAGINGLPTQNITGFALIQPIGHAINADSLMINFTTALLTT